MRLPNGDRAELGTKLEDYVLNANHSEGKHKARVFESALGITLDDIEVLRDAIIEAARTADDAVYRGDNGFGDVYVLRFPITTDRGFRVVLSAWIVRHGEDFPRLTTCYVH